MANNTDRINKLSPEQRQQLLAKLQNKGLKQIVGMQETPQEQSYIRYEQGDNFAYKLSYPPNFIQTEFVKCDLPAPAEGIIQVEVKAASLNFRDLMIAMDMYPAAPGIPSIMGSDYAGVITKVGANVDEFKVGDNVILLSVGSYNSDGVLLPESHFCKYQNVYASQAFLMPDNISFVEAACIPTVFLTSYYSLVVVGQVKSDDIVLIHSASGGVGLAAIEICKWLGCQVFATAGDDRKSDFLREIGIPLVMNSRDTSFADEIMEYTNGRGVDVVLNTLSGESMLAGLKSLNFMGRFLQIDKKDIAANNLIPLGLFNKGLLFASIDISLFGLDNKITKKYMKELCDLLLANQLKPIKYKEYPYYQLGDALNYMSRSKHIGKLVLNYNF
ncbi:MAG: zinc-binding dehydrogenase [Ignavibacteria bacterium]|jgi:NADPH:quinone reductase-like Zn-dependent oxidoreductase|nr:zinc-binding dehydrogenase [Ignavibacteria bacterium]